MLKLWGTVRDGDGEWQDQARRLLTSVVHYIEEGRKARGKRIYTEEYLAERKLIFLLDDLQTAVNKGDPSHFEALVEAINRAWVNLYEIRMMRSRK